MDNLSQDDDADSSISIPSWYEYESSLCAPPDPFRRWPAPFPLPPRLNLTRIRLSFRFGELDVEEEDVEILALEQLEGSRLWCLIPLVVVVVEEEFGGGEDTPEDLFGLVFSKLLLLLLFRLLDESVSSSSISLLLLVVITRGSTMIRRNFKN